MTEAVLLVNLGTPDAPTPGAVKRFLSEFLHDKHVIKLTRWLWCPILHGVVLPLRSPKVAKLYQSIWTPEGSPLKVITEKQVCDLQASLGDCYKVFYAMRYGQPSIKNVLKAIADGNFSKLRILPLYPQYSDTTTGSVIDEIECQAKKLKLPPWQIVREYHQDTHYIQALVESIQSFWKTNGKGEKLLLTYHGIPEEYVAAGDPYAEHCQNTTRAIAQALSLKPGEYEMSFQSRFGPKAWVKPYTEDVITDWTQNGVKKIDVISPSFSVDCLETLEEIKVTYKAQFEEQGGEDYRYITALNNSPAHIKMMAYLIGCSKTIL